jgi:hypothetical protein
MIAKAYCNIYGRGSAISNKWRAVDEIIRHYQKTGQYTRGDGIKAMNSPNNTSIRKKTKE